MTTINTTPRVHSNGTSRERLIETNLDAREAIGFAIVLLRRAAPNGRDYPLPEDQPRYAAAVAEHRAGVADLERLHERLGTLVEALDAGA
jgi:hypothetical protein